MKPPVPQTYRAGRSDEKELERQLRQQRALANQAISGMYELETAASNVLEEIYLSDELPKGSVHVLQAKVQGASADGTRFAAYELVGMFHRASSGAATQLGATVNKHTPIESDAALNCTIGVDANSKVFVKVLDAGLATMTWKAWVELRQKK